MNNFFKVAENINVFQVMHELFNNADLWNEHTLRTQHPGTAHSQVSDIWVWFNELPIPGEDNSKIIDDRHVIAYRAWHCLPSLRPIILDLMHYVKAVRLGRVVITKLLPGKIIDPHVDGGAPAEYYKRFQIALQSLPGANFVISNETVNFKTGEIWQIDNRLEHCVINNSAEDRIVCIADMRIE